MSKFVGTEESPSGKIMFDTNDRVMTGKGPGKVAYRRMRGPTYMEVECYSVVLDSKVEASKHPPFPQVNGTTFPAEEVREEERGEDINFREYQDKNGKSP